MSRGQGYAFKWPQSEVRGELRIELEQQLNGRTPALPLPSMRNARLRLHEESRFPGKRVGCEGTTESGKALTHLAF